MTYRRMRVQPHGLIYTARQILQLLHVSKRRIPPSQHSIKLFFQLGIGFRVLVVQSTTIRNHRTHFHRMDKNMVQNQLIPIGSRTARSSITRRSTRIAEIEIRGRWPTLLSRYTVHVRTEPVVSCPATSMDRRSSRN